MEEIIDRASLPTQRRVEEVLRRAKARAAAEAGRIAEAKPDPREVLQALDPFWTRGIEAKAEER
jgi:hypothetical protein